MSNSPEMQAFIASTERYLLSLGKDELNRRIDSRKDGDIGKLILEAGFLESESLDEENPIYQNEEQIEYDKDISVHEIIDRENRSPKYFSVAWSKLIYKEVSTSQPIQFNEMDYIPKIDYSYLSHHCRDYNNYGFEESEPWQKKKIA